MAHAAMPSDDIPQNHVSSPVISGHQQTETTKRSLCLMIDNYDSFTWNLYQYLCQLGADVLVKRNDEITIEEIEAFHTRGELRCIVISPGPGHPVTDSGISRDVIRWSLGKVPLLGVCMGLECVVDVFGGEIGHAGEIVHGKTSKVKHDAQGCFHDIPQLVPSTRYHSLALKLLTLPACLTVTATTEESGVVMGVRHRQHTIEAVQYHPESVMSDGGRELLANFLKLEGGSWGGKNSWCGVKATESPVKTPNGVSNAKSVAATTTAPTSTPPAAVTLPTILDRIHAQRVRDVGAAESSPATTPANLRSSIALHAAPPALPLLARLSQTIRAGYPAVMAEIKRASPSKGDIAAEASAPAQAIRYALAGASVISVLTEPTWFKGALSDLLAVRQALSSMPNRPALLRKDFILSTYQIDEARIHGADTVLLIVAMLTVPQLTELYAYSCSLGMEPLVEVNNAEELEIALDLGSKVIGVNNRNLHDFKVDMQTTSRLADVLRERGREDVILCALSGISARQDVERYVAEGVKAVLVGEALMRASDPGVFIKRLLGVEAKSTEADESASPLVKICGIQSLQDAQTAREAGADLLGMIFAQSKRQVSMPVARQICNYARSLDDGSGDDALLSEGSVEDPLNPLPWFAVHAKRIRERRSRPLVVGVFQNQPLSYIQRVAEAVGLDIVQLHGDEPQEWAAQIGKPVIKVFRVDQAGKVQGGGQVDRPGLNQLVLLDAAGANGSAGGGEGIKFDWSVASKIVDAGEAGSGRTFRLPIMLAGGLLPGNVADAVQAVRPWCVDVSSGVEGSDYRVKDAEKVRAFVKNAKA